MSTSGENTRRRQRRLPGDLYELARILNMQLVDLGDDVLLTNGIFSIILQPISRKIKRIYIRDDNLTLEEFEILIREGNKILPILKRYEVYKAV